MTVLIRLSLFFSSCLGLTHGCPVKADGGGSIESWMAGTSPAMTVFQRFFASLPVMAALVAAIHVTPLLERVT
jgi:hypothetical protein